MAGVGWMRGLSIFDFLFFFFGITTGDRIKQERLTRKLNERIMAPEGSFG